MLQKDVYPYEYIDDWEKFNETLLLKKEDFHSHLNMEDITNADFMHKKRVVMDNKKKLKRKHHNLYAQSNLLMETLFLANVFDNFQHMCLKIYELDPDRFITAPWKEALKKAKVKLDLLNYINMLLMAEKGIRGGI